MKPCFSKKNREKCISILLLVRDKSYFVKVHSKPNFKYKQDEIIQILDFYIDYIIVQFGARVFQQTIGILNRQ